ncbi:hypothetical protein RclHR1_37730001 [Rhizophagus clarus]|uniref:Uncharacterized protein n=1 Tax=Rhizophagus clarus TaxID=94130 RepID=A0A2Z6RCE8_9GLOM|nr:hypothetical protein RclHR1_37730001 [Rhizophagus clarus]GET01957.1 hypothetical protein RCL_e16515_RclHR1_37730001 [Rhizophagus clarus]
MWKQTELAWCKHSTPSFRSSRCQPKASGSGSKSFSFKQAGSSLVITGSNRTPLRSRKLQINNNNKHENNTNSPNLAQSQNSSGRSTSINSTKGSRKSSKGQTGNLNKVEIKHLLEQLISLYC